MPTEINQLINQSIIFELYTIFGLNTGSIWQLKISTIIY